MEASQTYGRVHSLESFGSVDGPGVRYVIFLQGCPQRCKFCHNPDSWKLCGERISAIELLKRALRYSDFWGKNGGITLSGGEPMLQPEFAAQFFRLARDRGIHTALDTSAQPFDLKDTKYALLLELCDLVLLDIKHIDSEKHRELTGFDNKNILECARYLDRKKIPVKQDKKYNIKIIACGNVFHVFVDDILCLQLFDLHHNGGRVGLFTECGKAEFENLSVWSID